MQRSRRIATTLLTVLLAGSGFAAERTPTTTATTFVVHCYDVGAGALTGRPGILSVERGWKDREEINRVFYDPQAVSLRQLEDWLKEAGTYVRTLPPVPAGETGR